MMSCVKYLLLCVFVFFFMSSANAGAWTDRTWITAVYAVNERQIGFKLRNFTNPTRCNRPHVRERIDIVVNPMEQPEILYYLDLAFSKNRAIKVWLNNKCEDFHWSGRSAATVGHVIVYSVNTRN